jgi:shikimate dehydrogenase
MKNIVIKAGVMGNPITHSLSPAIFNFIACQAQVKIDYQTYQVEKDEGISFLKKLKAEKEFTGFNVTLPLKELFLSELTSTSKAVNALGALNVLHFRDDGLHGFNTDIIGIEKTLEGKKFSVAKKNCLLLGAGGSAKAVCYVLGNLNAKKVFIYNRSERNEEIVLKFEKLFPQTQWVAVSNFTSVGEIDLVVNSTPLGMSGKDSGRDFFHNLKSISFTKEALAFDLIYTPENTQFLKVASSLGLATVGGLGMLIDQALATWKLWVGPLENEKELHLKLKDFLNGILKLRENSSPLFLTGFMGVGKSSVGVYLSELVKRDFLDVDRVAEKKAGMSIPQMFEQKGESYFRVLEHESIAELGATSRNSVISLGGGALMNPLSLESILKSGTLIYLSANEKTLGERIAIQGIGRPMLANLSFEEKNKKISELLNSRMDAYKKSHLIVETDNLDVSGVAFEILSMIGRMK